MLNYFPFLRKFPPPLSAQSHSFKQNDSGELKVQIYILLDCRMGETFTRQGVPKRYSTWNKAIGLLLWFTSQQSNIVWMRNIGSIRHLQSSVANGPMSPIVYCCICLESSLPETLASCTQSEKNNKSHKLFSATRTFREYFASGARVVNTSWLYNLTQHLKFIKALNQDHSAQLHGKGSLELYEMQIEQQIP